MSTSQFSNDFDLESGLIHCKLPIITLNSLRSSKSNFSRHYFDNHSVNGIQNTNHLNI